MVKIIVGEELTVEANEKVQRNFVPDYIYKNKFNQGQIVKFYAEDVGITKNILKFICKNATADVKIIVVDPKIVSGLRKSKNVSIVWSQDFEDVKGSSFDVARAILTCRDRDFLAEFLKARKEKLFMIVRILTSYYPQLTEHNRKMAMFLDKNFGKVSDDILYHLIAYNFQVQNSFWGKWLFPKKEEKEKETEENEEE